MGNDGGSIPKRDDLVKTKRTDVKAEEKSTLRQLYTYCALSKQLLRSPVASCALGKLYNKESLIAYLLTPPGEVSPFGHDGLLVASHIRSLKDTTTLKLTSNPTLTLQSTEETERSSHIGTQESRPTALFVCPISLREMNGSVKFVYRKPCGCVLSESSLTEMRKADIAGGTLDKTVCPVDGLKDVEGSTEEEFVMINPRGNELQLIWEAWEVKKVMEREAKKLFKKDKGDKKRKIDSNGSVDKLTLAVDSTTTIEVTAAKRAKVLLDKSLTPTVKAGASIPTLSATLAAKIHEQKKSQSAAVASLYAPRNADPNHDKDGRSNWMTRGAFTRYA